MNNNALISMKKDLPRQILINFFTTTFSESYKQEMRGKKLKCKEFQKILEKVLIIKTGKLGNCS